MNVAPKTPRVLDFWACRTAHTARSGDYPARVIFVLAANGDQATALVILASIVIPLAVLAAVCWFFWTHRHDE